MPRDIEISHVKEVVPAPDGGGVVVKAAAKLGEDVTDLEIAIAADLATRVAIALLATTAMARAARDGLEPALEVLAAAVVASGSAEKVRLQLLFDTGTVLPIEMPAEAGAILKKELAAKLGDANV